MVEEEPKGARTPGGCPANEPTSSRSPEVTHSPEPMLSQGQRQSHGSACALIHSLGRRDLKYHHPTLTPPRPIYCPAQPSVQSTQAPTEQPAVAEDRGSARPAHTTSHLQAPPLSRALPATHTHTPSPPGPAGDPSPFNHLAVAEEGLRHRAARNFPRGEREAQSVPVPRHAGSRRGGHLPSPPSPSSRPLPPYVPMHLLAEGGSPAGKG